MRGRLDYGELLGWPCVQSSQILTDPRLDSRLSTRMPIARRFCRRRALGGHGARGHGLRRYCWCAASHGALHNSASAARLCATRHVASVVVGPDTATGLISAVTVGAVATQGTAEFNTLTSTLAVLIGIFFFSFGVMRMGWVASFIPTPVMRGFIEGLVYVTIIGQMPHLLGISGASGNFFAKTW